MNKTKGIIFASLIVVAVTFWIVFDNSNQKTTRDSIDIYQDFLLSEKRAETAMNKWFDNMLHSDNDLKNTMAIFETEKEILDGLYNEYASLPEHEKTDQEIDRKIIGYKHSWLSYPPFIDNLKQQKEAERDFRITLEHHGCTKTCPVYSVMINGDGTVLYKGLKNVKEIGKREYAIPVDTLTELNGFLAEDYGRNTDEYGSPTGAENTVIITIDFGQVQRIVNHDNSGPDSLKEFEEKINEIANVRQYVFE